MSPNNNTAGNTAGTLFVVATPIGNLDDISLRARNVLADVACIAAEDTRRTGRMLDKLGITARLVSCHDHNEAERAPQLVQELLAGNDVALVSDAGTPLLSDPGFRLVNAALDAGAVVTPIPGCSAALAAVSASGLPTDRLLFEGFLPATAARRRKRLAELARHAETIVVYEAVHRIHATLADIVAEFGRERRVVAARELTKLHESFYRGTAAGVQAQLAADPGAGRGEYTLVIQGAAEEPAGAPELDRVLQVLLGYLGVRQSADAAARLLNVRKRDAYQRALELRELTDNKY